MITCRKREREGCAASDCYSAALTERSNKSSWLPSFPVVRLRVARLPNFFSFSLSFPDDRLKSMGMHARVCCSLSPPFSHFGFFLTSHFFRFVKKFAEAPTAKKSLRREILKRRETLEQQTFLGLFFAPSSFLSRERRQFLPEKAKFVEKREQKEEEEEGSEKKVCMFLLIWWVVRGGIPPPKKILPGGLGRWAGCNFCHCSTQKSFFWGGGILLPTPPWGQPWQSNCIVAQKINWNPFSLSFIFCSKTDLEENLGKNAFCGMDLQSGGGAKNNGGSSHLSLSFFFCQSVCCVCVLFFSCLLRFSQMRRRWCFSASEEEGKELYSNHIEFGYCAAALGGSAFSAWREKSKRLSWLWKRGK